MIKYGASEGEGRTAPVAAFVSCYESLFALGNPITSALHLRLRKSQLCATQESICEAPLQWLRPITKTVCRFIIILGELACNHDDRRR